jgi:hypothetical protein
MQCVWRLEQRGHCLELISQLHTQTFYSSHDTDPFRLSFFIYSTTNILLIFTL